MLKIRLIPLATLFLSVSLLPGCGGFGGFTSSDKATSSDAGAPIAVLPSSAVVVAEKAQVIAYQPDGHRAWSFNLPDGDTIAAPPVAALSSVTYVRGEQNLYAIAPDGRVLWQARHQGGGDDVHGITPLSDSTVAITTADRALIAYNSQGQTRWTYNLPEGEKIAAPPVLAQSSIVYLRTAKSIYAVDSGGNLAWVVEIGSEMPK